MILGLVHETPEMDSVFIRTFALQTAASLIESIEDMPKEPDQIPSFGTGGILAVYVKWSAHGYVNALQAPAQFLHSLVEFIIANPNDSISISLNDKKERELIANALRAYQGYKNDLIEKEREKSGRNWGAASRFATMDWTDKNNLFLGIATP